MLRRRQDRKDLSLMTTPVPADTVVTPVPTKDPHARTPQGKARSTMIETHGPALEAESKYRREKARDALAVRQAAYQRRAARAAQAQVLATGQTRGFTAVLRGWRLPGSGAWHAAR